MIRLIILVLGGIGLIAMYYYNNFIKGRNRYQDAWASIEVYLKQRYDLIPNLVETVKGITGHESNIYSLITQARSKAIHANGIVEQQEAEQVLSGTLKSLFALTENYPILASNANYLQLQNQLGKVEEDLQMSRRYYNATIRSFNNSIETFPGVIFAGMFGFEAMNYFEIDQIERERPDVKF
jgi:LemA protein